ncbi:hypothetical protein AYL99_04444 [Fonsecaea erecta]|uniref:BRCT domain-containing protein n=1 Tax=Fonsecaea erecta TaxID=1367422 RepID=A0A178ZS34_9EURO|nr:hypothetical protein AYL99_04444 [Fonsecaea erecta]OAP62241.1 hypothetical protein AYL99_04444 [Fonsecaea erecta]
MAPRKAVSPAKPRRVTRARAAGADAAASTTTAEAPKRRTTKASAVPTTSRAQALEAKSRVTKKSASTTASKTTKGGRVSTRSAKPAPVEKEDDSEHDDDDDDDEEVAVEVAVTKPPVKPSRTSTRTTANTSAPAATAGLAAAPRRRVKVTPLIPNETHPEPAAPPPAEEVKPEKKPSARAKKEKATQEETRPATSRTKKETVTSKQSKGANAENANPEPKKRGRGRTAQSEMEPEEEPPQESTSTAAKSRGRSRKEKVLAPPVEDTKSAPTTTRQTRARAGSTNSSVVAEPTISVMIPTKKKVTFEALPEDDDEKENKRPRNMTKTKSTKSAALNKAETAATGMRAKPIRKPATTRVTKTTRATGAAKPVKSRPQTAGETTSKIQDRALTPKKITQVAKAMPADTDDDEEDELAGAKTPVRDLSLSPKRGLAAAATRPLSPVKRLDFSPGLHLASPQKSDASAIMGMLSPPRRPASPAKDSLKESPRRAPEGVTVFRASVPDAHIGGSLVLDPSYTQSILHQSPKRGLSDKMVFPPSAVKSRTTPLKTSLLSSPARRLFSPSKQRTPAQMTPSFRRIPEQESPESPNHDEAGPPHEESEEIAVSSHFRSSMSPQRSAKLYRLSEDELAEERNVEMDFDQSVLNIRSPLKVDKVKPVSETLAEEMVVDDPPVEDDVHSPVEGDGYGECMEVHAIDNTAAVPVEADETIADPKLEQSEASDEEEGSGIIDPRENQAHTAEDFQQTVGTSVKKPRMSDALFNRVREVDDDSDDELAGDQTPANRVFKPTFGPSMTSAGIRSRISTGVVPQSASKNLGFTPLAAQVQGWRAASPEKKTAVTAKSRGLFSPVAQMHIAGSVELSRPDTPGREASKRKSTASRHSLAPSLTESPSRPDFFAEGMAALDFEVQVGADAAAADDEDLHNLIPQDTSERDTSDQVNDEVDSEAEATSGEDMAKSSEELTTDLVNYINASDTAMVDFKALAHEAEDLAAQEEHDEEATADEQEANATVPTVMLETVNEEQSMLSVSTSSGSYGDENTAPVEQSATEESDTDETEELPTEESAECHAKVIVEPEECHDEDGHGVSEYAEEQEDAMNAPSNTEDQLFEVTAMSIETSPSRNDCTPAKVDSAMQEMDFSVTPVRPDPSLPRVVHTVVSKVPLRPEGAVAPASSPLKVQRKRPRSLSSSHVQAVKRRSLGPSLEAPSFEMNPLATPKANVASVVSPQRRIRSAAPSPANSLATGLSTPGQMSFCIEDFGDSTLDGIELPEEELTSDDVETEDAYQDESFLTVGSALFRTPAATSKRSSIVSSTAQSNTANTPRYAMSTKSSTSRVTATPKFTPSKGAASASKTPATNARAKAPSTQQKPKSATKTPQTGRNPLKQVGNGVLHGAVVHTDIHTSEGMDASAFYIDMLTSMGARVVREWRWNPRASINQDSTDSEAPIANVGITHVVYKDGGKRTLEKVRAAKGQVLCVGVGWVLDCMREIKWLDESAYAVDASIMPRGGSRRRKSMEPRMLVNENGLLSASREQRRSLSAEYAGLTGRMKQELINTPVRGNEVFGHVEHPRSCIGVEDESEISSTYNSPTAATVWGGGDTANVGVLMAQQDCETPASVERKTNTAAISTPKSVSLDVDYDPRTAATPLTPYLVAKGRELVQMSAPPKQINKSIFDRDDDDAGAAGGTATGGQKFHVKMKGKSGKGVLDARRKTLG